MGISGTANPPFERNILYSGRLSACYNPTGYDQAWQIKTVSEKTLAAALDHLLCFRLYIKRRTHADTGKQW